MTYDITIVGAGPGGYVAAIRAAQEGFKVALIEKQFVGGTCLNYGCIPTKSFAAVADRFRGFGDLEDMGVVDANITNARVDIAKVVNRKNKIVEGLRGGIKQLLKGNKVDLIEGTASFVSPTELKVSNDTGNQSLITNNCIIATGSTWRPLPNLAPDGKFILTSDHMLDLTEIPKKFLIVGGGVIGCEFASIMKTFGSEVAIVEVADRILPLEDELISRTLALSFKKRGINIYTKTTVTGVANGNVNLSSGEVLPADKVLVSVGRKPYTDGLNLEGIGVEMKNGFVLTDEKLSTNIKNIFAIGDVSIPKNGSPKPQLAHVASNEGLIVIANLKSQVSDLKSLQVIPRPIFTHPEIGCVGMTETELKTKGIKYNTGRFTYSALSKAICDGDKEGLLQVYTEENGKILGAHCIGAHATDICSEISLAVRNGLTAKDVADTIHAHPTYSEIVAEAVEDTFGMAIHKPSSRR